MFSAWAGLKGFHDYFFTGMYLHFPFTQQANMGHKVGNRLSAQIQHPSTTNIQRDSMQNSYQPDGYVLLIHFLKIPTQRKS